MNPLLRAKYELQARWHAYRLRRLLRKAVQSIRKTTGDTADFAEILKIWEKQLTIAASDRPKYWKQSAQEELQQAFELRYQSLLKKMAMRQEETKQE